MTGPHAGPVAALLTILTIIGTAVLGITGLTTLTGIAMACAAPPPIGPPTTPPTTPTPATAVSDEPAPAPSSPPPPAGDVLGRYNDEQLTNAALIVDVGAGLGIPPQGWVIAVSTAIQESSLRNLPDLGPDNDHDSLGLFQQRPSQGWGTPTQLTDPAYAAGAFYSALLDVPDWQTMALTDAAQAVQRSAYPDAYARWETDATALVTAVHTGQGGCRNGDGMIGTPADLPSDFTLPAGTSPQVALTITWALSQLGTPYSYGGDCTAPHSGDPARQCDCSSLIQQAYAHAGITVPRTTDTQQHTGVRVLTLTDLRPGDLVFIPGSNGTRADPGHVGLYIGNDTIVQAPHTGDVVKLTPLRDWAPDIVAIRRVTRP